MKKCPVCDKEFPDSMRFCQVDGTPLVEEATAPPPDDPYKTTVGRQQDIASAIPPVDPFATMVNTSFKKEDSGDLLQLPDEKVDPLKTMYASESEIRSEMEKLKSDAPPVSNVAPPVKPESPIDNPFASPPTPVFSEPNITPPSFGEAPLSEQKTAVVSNPFNEPKRDSSASASSGLGEQKTEIISNPFNESPKQDYSSPLDEKPASPFDEKPASPFDSGQKNTFDNLPFSSGGNTGPIPSPFDSSMPPGYQTPSAPLPEYKEPESSSSLPKYAEPANQSSDQNSPFNSQPPVGQGAIVNNQYDNNQNWNAPPAPDSNWQNQPASQGASYQPPASGGGQNQTLAIVSLVLGIIGIVLCQLTGPVAVILGIMARKKANQNPAQYGGSGLALGGIITGVIGTVLLVLVALYFILVFGIIASSSIR